MNAPNENHRSGYVAITGLPNVGKSTFLNSALGERLAIVTPKPQTTRDRIAGIYHAEGAQIVFVDTPGVCMDSSKLNARLNREVSRALEETDVILFLVDSAAPIKEAERVLAERIGKSRKPKVLVFNKIDALKEKEKLLARQEAITRVATFDKVYSISALRNEDVRAVLDGLTGMLPLGPPMFGEDEITTANMRFLVAEMIREQIFLQTDQEIPYSTAVEVQSYNEPEREGGLLRIEADIVVEKDGQKGIIIGAGGKKLGRIGQEARMNIEKFTGSRVMLKLFVKVRKNWTSDDRALKNLGYV